MHHLKSHFRLLSHTIVALQICFAPFVVHAGAYEDFFRAVNIDDTRAVSRLLERGFDPNAASERGQTALYLALRDASPRVAELLIAHPLVQIDAVNAAGETALMMAALRGQRDAAQQLIARGAQINRVGWTPLHYAASGADTTVLLLLLDSGATVDAPSPNRTTPLMMASRYGSDEAAFLLLARGADPRFRNDQGLHAADFARLGAREKLALRLDAAAR